MPLVTQNVGGASDPIRRQSAADVLPTGVNAALKDVYSSSAVVSLTVSDRALFGILPRKKDFLGQT
jgi:hypothetical protein